MANAPLAQIIPFPGVRASRSPMAQDQAPPAATPDQERLARALASLNAALAEQRAAVTAWCGALAALKQTTERLKGGLQQYHGSLGALGERVSQLNKEAVKLEAWADKVLAEKA